MVEVGHRAVTTEDRAQSSRPRRMEMGLRTARRRRRLRAGIAECGGGVTDRAGQVLARARRWRVDERRLMRAALKPVVCPGAPLQAAQSADQVLLELRDGAGQRMAWEKEVGSGGTLAQAAQSRLGGSDVYLRRSGGVALIRLPSAKNWLCRASAKPNSAISRGSCIASMRRCHTPLLGTPGVSPVPISVLGAVLSRLIGGPPGRRQKGRPLANPFRTGARISDSDENARHRCATKQTRMAMLRVSEWRGTPKTASLRNVTPVARFLSGFEISSDALAGVGAAAPATPGKLSPRGWWLRHAGHDVAMSPVRRCHAPLPRAVPRTPGVSPTPISVLGAVLARGGEKAPSRTAVFPLGPPLRDRPAASLEASRTPTSSPPGTAPGTAPGCPRSLAQGGEWAARRAPLSEVAWGL